MDNAQFWQLIEESQNKNRDCERQAKKLEKLLTKLSSDEIIGFENIFTLLLVQSYSWDLWGAAYIINGGCSDDGFEYFRYWLIAQGQTYFEAALQDPERAGDSARFEEAECEEIGYAAREPYRSKTGHELGEVANAVVYPDEPTGQPWQEDELEARFPRLCEKFG